MPGPGYKKPKPKPRQITDGTKSATPESYLHDLDDAEGWERIVDVLCDGFELPDLSTRSGLKKVHRHFDELYQRLEAVYERYPGNKRLRGGIVGIYTRMCVDSLLRNKLTDRGIVKKLIPLLDNSITRYPALRALATICHHGRNPNVKIEIARYSSTLVRLAQSFPNDQVLVELVVVILTLSVIHVIGSEEPINPKLLPYLDMRAILKVATDSMTKDWASVLLISHATSLIAASTLNASDACKRNLAALPILVAGLRSMEWSTRCTCLAGIIRFHRRISEPDNMDVDSDALMANFLAGIPEHLMDVMDEYGPTYCEIPRTILAIRDFDIAMAAYVKDRNLYAFGLKIGELILETELSITDGQLRLTDPETGRTKPEYVGLPFKRSRDALPHCARAIRAKGDPNEADIADMLDIKYLLMIQCAPRAVEIAKKALIRTPDNVYFYYVISLSLKRQEGLRAAKKGLKCKNIPAYIRFQLLQRAVEHAADMGIMTLSAAGALRLASKWEEGMAFVMSAFQDALIFLNESPPDNQYRLSVLYWYSLLSLAIDDSISPDLNELEGALHAITLAEDFSNAIGVPPPKTNMRLAQEMVVQTYPKAVEQYGHIFAKTDPSQDLDKQNVPPEKLREDLAAWLEGKHLDDEGREELTVLRLHPRINRNHVEMYRCSWCTNTSAALRKCGGCSKARYCDADCQRFHWSEHKKSCGTGRRENVPESVS